MVTMIKLKNQVAGQQTICSKGTDLGYLPTIFNKLA